MFTYSIKLTADLLHYHRVRLTKSSVTTSSTGPSSISSRSATTRMSQRKTTTRKRAGQTTALKKTERTKRTTTTGSRRKQRKKTRVSTSTSESRRRRTVTSRKWTAMEVGWTVNRVMTKQTPHSSQRKTMTWWTCSSTSVLPTQPAAGPFTAHRTVCLRTQWCHPTSTPRRWTKKRTLMVLRWRTSSELWWKIFFGSSFFSLRRGNRNISRGGFFFLFFFKAASEGRFYEGSQLVEFGLCSRSGKSRRHPGLMSVVKVNRNKFNCQQPACFAWGGMKGEEWLPLLRWLRSVVSRMSRARQEVRNERKRWAFTTSTKQGF